MRSRKSPTWSVSNATTNSWSSIPNEYVVLIFTVGKPWPVAMCSFMIPCRAGFES